MSSVPDGRLAPRLRTARAKNNSIMRPNVGSDGLRPYAGPTRRQAPYDACDATAALRSMRPRQRRPRSGSLSKITLAG